MGRLAVQLLPQLALLLPWLPGFRFRRLFRASSLGFGFRVWGLEFGVLRLLELLVFRVQVFRAAVVGGPIAPAAQAEDRCCQTEYRKFAV